MTAGFSKTEMLRFFHRSFRFQSSHYYTVIRSPSSAFHWCQNVWPWMTFKRDSRCFVLALASDTSASTRLPCLAYINVPLSTYFKIRYVWSRFTVASRGSPCDSTAFLYQYQVVNNNNNNTDRSGLILFSWSLTSRCSSLHYRSPRRWSPARTVHGSATQPRGLRGSCLPICAPPPPQRKNSNKHQTTFSS